MLSMLTDNTNLANTVFIVCFLHEIHRVWIVSHHTCSTAHVMHINQDDNHRWVLNLDSRNNHLHYKCDRNGNVSYAIVLVVGSPKIHRENAQKHFNAIHSHVVSSHYFLVLTYLHRMFNLINRPLLVTKLRKTPNARISLRQRNCCGMIQCGLKRDSAVLDSSNDNIYCHLVFMLQTNTFTHSCAFMQEPHAPIGAPPNDAARPIEKYFTYFHGIMVDTGCSRASTGRAEQYQVYCRVTKQNSSIVSKHKCMITFGNGSTTPVRQTSIDFPLGPT